MNSPRQSELWIGVSAKQPFFFWREFETGFRTATNCIKAEKLSSKLHVCIVT